jgi:hypothetical protein
MISVTRSTVCGLIVFVASGASGQAHAQAAEPSRPRCVDLLKRVSVIFEGTVAAVGVARPGVPASPHTMTVRVTKPILTPPALNVARDMIVTLDAIPETMPKVKDTARFYSSGWMLGDSLALREVCHEPVQISAAAGAAAVSSIVTARANDAAALFMRSFQSADLACSGHVTAFSSPASKLGTRQITEHDPHWRIATIAVDSWIKGAIAGGSIRVRFPDSNDVIYKKNRKPQLNTPAIFLVRRAMADGACDSTGADASSCADGDLMDVLPPTYRNLFTAPPVGAAQPSTHGTPPVAANSSTTPATADGASPDIPALPAGAASATRPSPDPAPPLGVPPAAPPTTPPPSSRQLF